MSIHTDSPTPIFDDTQVLDLAAHLRYNGDRVAVGTQSTYNGDVVAVVVVVTRTDDDGQDWYGVYDADTFDEALVSNSFEDACALMEGLADLIDPDSIWEFTQAAPRP